MDKVHIENPEPIVFLELAAEKLEEHRQAHGTYPGTWSDLDIAFANGAYRLTDPGIRPPARAGSTWRPKRCQYTYRLSTKRGEADFQIDALDREGRVVYFINSQQPKPSSVNRSRRMKRVPAK